MTLVSPGKPARTISKGVICDTEDAVENLYTCPANCRAEVSLLYIVNVNGTTDAEAQWYKADTAETFRLVGGKNLSSGETVLLTGATLVLEAGDRLDAIASNNASPEMDFICTVTETFIPVG